MSHPIENIMKTTMDELKRMVDVNTIVGEPLVSGDGTMIMPVSRVSLGFVSGGGEYGEGASILKKNDNVEVVDDVKHPFAGVSTAGVQPAITAATSTRQRTMLTIFFIIFLL